MCFPPQLPNKLHAQGPAVKKRRTGEFATSLDACLMCNSPGQRILSFVFASFELTSPNLNMALLLSYDQHEASPFCVPFHGLKDSQSAGR